MIYRSVSVLLSVGVLLGCASKWADAPVTHFALQPYGVNVRNVQLAADEFDIMSVPDTLWAGTAPDQVTARAPVVAGMKQMADRVCQGRPYEITDQAFGALTLTARVRCGR